MTGSGGSVSQTKIEQFLLLRATVGFLGEKEQFGWWDTSFLSPVGQKYLLITFPRSALPAGIEAAAQAARRLHDERIGKGRVFHLFRLPHGLEHRLHQAGLRAPLDSIRKSIESRDAALQVLESLSKPGEQPPEGPVRLGEAKALEGGAIVGRLAGIYLGAFKSSRQVLPYFTATATA